MGNLGLIPGLGRFSGEGKGYPLQYSGLENSVHGVTKSWTLSLSKGFPGGAEVKKKSFCLQCGRPGFDPWVRKIPWRRKWQSTLVFLLGESHGWRSFVGYSPQVAKSWTRLSDFTHSLFSIASIVHSKHLMPSLCCGFPNCI